MQELIKYFESLEARLNTLEQRVAALEQHKENSFAQLKEVRDALEKSNDSILKVQSILEEAMQKNELLIVPDALESAPEPVVEAEPEPEIPEVPEISEEPEPVVEVPEPEPEKEPEPIVEEVASPNASLYGKAVTDIRQAISLGDRFLFQRELFGQNAELMQRTLSELDALSSFDEAVNYISRFNWDQESNTYQQFLVTLHRRFG